MLLTSSRKQPAGLPPAQAIKNPATKGRGQVWGKSAPEESHEHHTYLRSAPKRRPCMAAIYPRKSCPSSRLVSRYSKFQNSSGVETEEANCRQRELVRGYPAPAPPSMLWDRPGITSRGFIGVSPIAISPRSPQPQALRHRFRPRLSMLWVGQGKAIHVSINSSVHRQARGNAYRCVSPILYLRGCAQLMWVAMWVRRKKDKKHKQYQC
jgi:hypothetical protein